MYWSYMEVIIFSSYIEIKWNISHFFLSSNYEVRTIHVLDQRPCVSTSRKLNNILSHGWAKQTLWPADYDSSGKYRNSTLFKMAQTFFNNTIIVRLHYKNSEIEFTKLDVRTTMTDKIANFGGTFGIWAELTGVSLLGLINLLIISIKLLIRLRN